MTTGELEVLNTIKWTLPEILAELKRMNQLKALELKGKSGYDMNITINQVDDIMSNQMQCF